MMVLRASFIEKKPIAARFFCLIALLLPPAQAGATALTPEAAVRLALLRPDAAHVVNARIDIARAELTAARLWPNPELRMERVSAGRPDDEGDEASFLLTQKFEISGRRALQRHAALIGLSAAEAEAAAERQRIRLEVLRRFYTALAKIRQAEVFRTHTRELDALSRVATDRHDAGDLSGYASRRISQSRDLLRSRLDEIETEVLAARMQLASLLGIEAASVVIDENVDLLPDPQRLGSREEDDRLVNAELAALDSRREFTAAAARAADRPSLPVTLGVGQRRIEGPTGSDTALLLEVSLPLPLFDRNQAGSARAEAEARHAESLYQLTLQEMQSRQAAALAKATRLTAAAQRLRAEVVPESRALTLIARNSFVEGELDLPGLLAAFDAQITAAERSIAMQQQARTAWIELDHLTRSSPSPTGEMP